MCATVANRNTTNITQDFKKIVAEFRLLHSVTKVLKKLDSQTINTPEIEANIFLNLQILKNMLSVNLVGKEALEFNINFLLVKQYLSTYKYNIIINNNLIAVAELRKAIKENKINNQEVVILLQFEFYLHSNKLANQAKVETLLTHLSQKIKQLNNVRNTIDLFNYSHKYSVTNIINKKSIIEQVIKINEEINKINNFEQLLSSNVIKDLRSVKNNLQNYFWLPEILSYLVLVNLNLREKFIYLLEEESQFIKYSVENLILLGINFIPKLNKLGILDLSKVYKFVSDINIWINQEYNNNYKNLMKLGYISNAVRQAVKNNLPDNNNIFIEYVNKVEHKEYDLTKEVLDNSQTEWMIVSTEVLLDMNDKVIENKGSITNIPIKKEKSVLLEQGTQNYQKNNYSKLINTNYLQKKWAEEQIEKDIDNIINILTKRAVNAPKQIIKLKYSDLILNKKEVSILINGSSQKTAYDKAKYILIRRAIALFIELQEIIAFYDKREELLGISWGIYGLKNVLYYLEETKIVISNIDNYINDFSRDSEDNKFDLVLIKNKLEEIIEQVYLLFDKAKINTFSKLVAA
ncbi:MAG: hypothetical protein WAQ98_07695 [Blastocatellia bacterium]